MRLTLVMIVIIVVTSPLALAQTGPATKSAEPFKLGTFEIRGVVGTRGRKMPATPTPTQINPQTK